MLRLSNIRIFTKLMVILTLIGVIVGGCVWYAQSRMRQIDQDYSAFINNEAAATAEARRLNRLVFELNYWVYRIIAETEEAQMQSANRGFEAAVLKVKPTLETLRKSAPTFTARIDQQNGRIERFMREVC